MQGICEKMEAGTENNYMRNKENEIVHIVSYPRTETNWIQELVLLLANNLNFEERITTEWCSPLIIPITYSNRSITENCKEQIILKEIRENIKQPKIIYVTRKPEDMCRFLYNYKVHFERYTGTFDEFGKIFVNGQLSYGSYWEHMLRYWQERHKYKILFLKYEEIEEYLPVVIKKASDFLGILLTECDVLSLVHHLRSKYASRFKDAKNALNMINMSSDIKALFEQTNEEYNSKFGYKLNKLLS